jgi:hypothetical protein
MNRYLAALGWAVVGFVALVALNLIFFAFVVGLDTGFGEAPQFTAPMFVPLLVCGLACILLLLRRRRVSSSRDNRFDDSPITESARGRRRSLRPSRLRSVLVIRRQPSANSPRQERSYETSN